MRIALAILIWFRHGGAQRDCAAIAAGLAKLGHDGTILTRQWQGPRPSGIAVVELPAGGFTNHARAQAFAAAVAARRKAERDPDFPLGLRAHAGSTPISPPTAAWPSAWPGAARWRKCCRVFARAWRWSARSTRPKAARASS